MLERNQLPQVKEERKEAKVKTVDRNEVGEISTKEKIGSNGSFFGYVSIYFVFKKKSCVMLRGTKWNQRGG